MKGKYTLSTLQGQFYVFQHKLKQTKITNKPAEINLINAVEDQGVPNVQKRYKM